ncbi:MAG: hypothetical protein K6B14_07875 [Lachnospiraceae bacterium]|nr:hypothetical protein [Lachnospiraceae bacterium]
MDLQLTTRNIATLLIDGSTIFMLGGLLLETRIMKKRNLDDDRLFYILLRFNLILALADMVTYLADEKDFPGARYLNMGGITVFYMVLNIMLMLWLQYCLVRFRRVKREIRSRFFGYFVPGIIIEILVVINIFTGILFSVDENNVYHHGVLFIPMFVTMGYLALLCFIQIGRYKTHVDREKLIPIWIFVLPIVAGLFVPFVLGGISLTSPGCAMSIMFTHLGSAAEINVKGGEMS